MALPKNSSGLSHAPPAEALAWGCFAGVCIIFEGGGKTEGIRQPASHLWEPSRTQDGAGRRKHRVSPTRCA